MTRRDPHPDNDIVDELLKGGAFSQSGTSGGNLARSIGSRDEQGGSTGSDPEATAVHKSDKPGHGASPNPRDGTDLGGS